MDKTDKDVECDILHTPSSDNSDIAGEVADSAVIKKAYRKLDFRILLWYSFVYLVLQIHKSNITNVAIINVEQGTGIKKQLGNLTSGQWAWCLSIFYYPYATFEPVSTVLLKRFKPNVWMSRIMISWGICSMCQGAVHNYAGLLATRFFLGLMEAGFYPGVLFHLAFWYPADKLALRIAFFYACGQYSGTISGLLAFAISYMNGVGGLPGWRWVFILEGIPAILCGLYTWFLLPNYPDTAKFLTPEEKSAVIGAVPKTQPQAQAKAWDLKQVKGFFTDPLSLTFSMLWICHAIGGWGVSTVLPTVIYQLGLVDSAITQLMTMPTYTFGFLSLVGIGFLIEKKVVSSWIAALCLESFACVCYIVLITVKLPIVKYVFVTLALTCGICIYPIIWPERIRAAHGTTSAALAIGVTNAAAQFQGIVGPQVYQSKFGPSYKIPFAISIGMLVGAMFFMLLSWWMVVRREPRNDQTSIEGEVSESKAEARLEQS